MLNGAKITKKMLNALDNAEKPQAKNCKTCHFFAELKTPFVRSDGAVIYGYCFKNGDKDYSPDMGKGYPVFIDGGVCKAYKKSKKEQTPSCITDARKSELYDMMIAWICENSSDEELFSLLHNDFGMTQEELHDHCIESLDRFFIDQETPTEFTPLRCRRCNCKLTFMTAAGEMCSSEYNGTDICDTCMVEHCLGTNCLGCEIGAYPNCQFQEMKKCYMEFENEL